MGWYQEVGLIGYPPNPFGSDPVNLFGGSVTHTLQECERFLVKTPFRSLTVLRRAASNPELLKDVLQLGVEQPRFLAYHHLEGLSASCLPPLNSKNLPQIKFFLGHYGNVLRRTPS